MLRRLTECLVFSAVTLGAAIRYPRAFKSLARMQLRAGQWPRVGFPRSANDKMLWRKIFDRNPAFTEVSDKIAVKDWACGQAPGLRAAQLLWQGTDPEDIPQELFSRDILVKPNNGSGGNYFLRGSTEGRQELRADMVADLRKRLRDTYGQRTLEWGYFNVPPKVLVEEIIADAGPELVELKFYMCGNRAERIVQILDRFGAFQANAWEPDAEGKISLLARPVAVSPNLCRTPLPANAADALRVAEALAAPFDQMRVDLYTDGTDVWLGELTVYNQGGYIASGGEEPGSQISRAWDIRQSWFLKDAALTGWRALYARLLRGAQDRYHAGLPPLGAHPFISDER